MDMMNKEDFYKMIIYNTKMFAKRKNIPIGELEKKMGVAIGYMSRTKNGKTNINGYLIYQILKIFDISLEDLLVEHDWELMELQDKAKDLGYKLTKDLGYKLTKEE